MILHRRGTLGMLEYRLKKEEQEPCVMGAAAQAQSAPAYGQTNCCCTEPSAAAAVAPRSGAASALAGHATSASAWCVPSATCCTLCSPGTRRGSGPPSPSQPLHSMAAGSAVLE